MDPRIEHLPETKVVGISATMSLSRDATPRIWRAFMPRRDEIANRVSTDYVSMRVYRGTDARPTEMFAPDRPFRKWAAVEVTDHDVVPDGMEPYTLGGGTYAVFTHTGPASAFPDTLRYIFDVWLPASDYELDDREHFEVLPEDWSAANADAREEIWVPVRPRRARS